MLQAAVGIGAGTVDDYAGTIASPDVEHAEWRLWHGRWQGCLLKLARVRRWTETKRIRDIDGAQAL